MWASFKCKDLPKNLLLAAKEMLWGVENEDQEREAGFDKYWGGSYEATHTFIPEVHNIGDNIYTFARIHALEMCRLEL